MSEDIAEMTNIGSKIVAGLKDAVAGNFARVTIDGPTPTKISDLEHEAFGTDQAWKLAQMRIEALEKALKPFAAIKPSSFFAEDGSESEGYVAYHPAAADKVEFIGEDLARARAALGEKDATR